MTPSPLRILVLCYFFGLGLESATLMSSWQTTQQCRKWSEEYWQIAKKNEIGIHRLSVFKANDPGHGLSVGEQDRPSE